MQAFITWNIQIKIPVRRFCFVMIGPSLRPGPETDKKRSRSEPKEERKQVSVYDVETQV